jgi:hypothetical protein
MHSGGAPLLADHVLPYRVALEGDLLLLLALQLLLGLVRIHVLHVRVAAKGVCGVVGAWKQGAGVRSGGQRPVAPQG